MIRKFEISHYDQGKDSLEDLSAIIEKSYRINQEFFSGKIVPVKVHFVYTREEMDRQMGKKTPNWVVGIFDSQKGEVFIFSPSVYEKESSHKVSSFSSTVTHEIAHIFAAKLYGLRYPKWLNEGLAQYVEQNWLREIDKGHFLNFKLTHTQEGWDKHPQYGQAAIFTKYLIEFLGKNNFLKFIKLLNPNGSYKDFCQKFQEYFHCTLDECRKNWEKTLIIKC